MRVNRILFMLAVLMMASLNSVLVFGVPQDQELSKVVARKFDEFELTDIYYGDMKARLDNFYTVALTKEPNSKAYAILYRSRKSFSRFTPLRIRDYLVKMRGMPANRVKVVYGNYRKVPTLELWVVPEGAADPQATPTAHLKKRSNH